VERAHAGPVHPQDSPLRVVLVGAGEWGATWAGQIRSAPGYELAAIVELDADLGREAAAGAGLPPGLVFDSVAAAAGAAPLDVAVIAVPPPAHGSVALQALDAGLHCLIEKPLAPTLEESREIAARGEAAGRVVMVSQNYRFRAGSRTVGRLLAAGAIGRVGTVGITFMRSFAPTGFRLHMEEPLLLDMAVHHFDLLRTVVGLEPTSVWAATSNPPWSPFEGNAEGFVRFEAEGASIGYTGTWASRGRQTGWGGAWEIQGDAGGLYWEDDRIVIYPGEQGPSGSRLARRLRAFRPTGGVELDRGAAADRAGVLRELDAAIRERREPAASAKDNVRTIALVTAAVESARSGVAVVLP
jgi:predicted dehydrogenase